MKNGQKVPGHELPVIRTPKGLFLFETDFPTNEATGRKFGLN